MRQPFCGENCWRGPSHGNRMNVDAGLIEVRSAVREKLLRSNSGWREMKTVF
jgi:hypothetical protein